MSKQKVGMRRTVRCPRCKFENLAIDIWCERCGTPIDWQGTPTTGMAPENGHKNASRNGNGRPTGLAALAGGIPWLKGNSSPRTAKETALKSEPAPVAAAAAAGPAPVASPPIATAAEAEVEEPVARPAAPPAIAARLFCPGCGQLNEASNKFCPRCGHVIGAVAAGTGLGGAKKRSHPRAARPRQPRKPLRLPTLKLPQLSLPKMSLPRMRFPRVPVVAWAVAAVVLVLLIAPLAYVLSPSARRPSATRPTPSPALTKTGAPAAGSAVAAAVPGVEAKTGLRYSAGSCPSNKPCLRLAGQTTGLNAAAVQFSTAATGGRQCAGYVYQSAGSWHFVDASCGLPGQVSPLVGNQASVHVPGQCANVRDAAGLQGSVIVCINDGTSVRVDGGPNYADGKLWWHLEKNGWMAHEFLVSS